MIDIERMKKYRISWFSLLFSFVLSASQAQKLQTFNVVETDTSKFPLLNVVIQLNRNFTPLENDFKVLDEDKSELEFTLAKKGEEKVSTKGRVIFFLVDASNYTDGLPIENFKKAVIESLELLNEDDLINVGYFGKEKEDGQALTMLSSDFTSNTDLIRSEIRTRITASVDSTAASDTYKAIYESLNLLQKSQDEGQKMLILISGAVNNPNSVFKMNDLIDRAQKLIIPIHTVNYKVNNQFSGDTYRLLSDRTEADSYYAKSSSDIKNAIGNFFERRVETTKEEGIQQYVLSFETKMPADGELHQYTLIYREDPPEVINYITPKGINAPQSNSFLSRYGIIVFVIVGIVVALAIWQYNEYRMRKAEELEAEDELKREREMMEMQKYGDQQSTIKELQERNIRLQEQLRAKEQELAKSLESIQTIIPNQKFDLKQTSISGGGGAPLLLVSAGVFSKNFRLNKPTMTIGRNANNDIVIPEPTISAYHATITIENGSFFINDLSSTNGTFVNGTKIDKKILKSGDLIKLGMAACRFEI